MGIARKAHTHTAYVAGKTTRPGFAVGQKGPQIATSALVRSPASRHRFPRGTFPNLHRPSQLPHFRQQSRKDNRALKSSRGWRREFRISQRIMVIDAAVSRPSPRRRLRRGRKQGRVLRWAARCAADAIARGSKLTCSREGIRAVSFQGHGPANLPRRRHLSKRGQKTHIPQLFGRLGSCVS